MNFSAAGVNHCENGIRLPAWHAVHDVATTATKSWQERRSAPGRENPYTHCATRESALRPRCEPRPPMWVPPQTFPHRGAKVVDVARFVETSKLFGKHEAAHRRCSRGVCQSQQTTIRTSLRLLPFFAKGFQCDMLPSTTTLFAHGLRVNSQATQGF